MKVSKSLTLELEDMQKINDLIRDGEFDTFSQFTRQAIKEKLKQFKK